MRAGSYLLAAAGMLAAGAAACAFTLHLSRYGFSGYDVSPMLDAGWRVLRGQVPGRDFVVTFPPSLYLLTALCFHVFGVTWRSTALGACCVYAVLLALGLRLGALAAKLRGAPQAVRLSLVLFAAQTIPLVSINYLWHASLAQSFACDTVFAAFVAVMAAAPAQKALRGEACLHLALGSACLLLSKPNTAWPALVVCLVALQRSGGVRRRVIAIVPAGAAVLASLALACAHVTPWGMLAAYVGLAGRLVPRAFVNGILYGLYARYGLANLLVYALLGPALFCAVTFARERRSQIAEDPVLVLGFGSVAVALLGMGTNFDFKLIDAPLLLLGLALLATSQERPGALWARTATATAALLLLSLYFGVTRFRMQILGTWADDKCPARVSFDDPFLGSFRACAVVPQTLAEVDRTLLRAEGERVFFGPSLEFLYPARRIPSPLHLPNWWDPGSSYPLRRTGAIEQAWEQDHFDLLVFPREEDRAQLPAAIQAAIEQEYTAVPGTEWIHVYRHR